MSAVVIFLCFLVSSASAEFSTHCGLLPADIVFVFDSSGSETPNDFQQQINFMKNFSSQFTIGPNATQFSSVTFSTGVTNNFYLNQYGSQSTLQSGMNKVNYLNGETNTHLALDFVRTHSLNTHNGARPNDKKYVIVLTDGRSNEEQLTVHAANALKSVHNVTVIAIGIGDKVDSNELHTIATDSKHMFTVQNFDLLATLEKELVDRTCTLCGDEPADIAFLLDSSGSEGQTNFAQQINFASLVTNEFNIPTDTRIAAATFATSARNQFYFSNSDKAAVLHALQRIHYSDGETRTDLGLSLLKNDIFGRHYLSHSHHGHSHDAVPARKKFAIVLTDGRSNEPELTQNEASHLKHAGVEVFVVGIGSAVDTRELNAIATDSRHVFTVPNFKLLDSVHGKIVEGICRHRIEPSTTVPPTTTPTTTTTPATTTTVKPECGPKPADIVFVLDSSESEKQVNFEKQRDFVNNFAKRFQIGPNNVQFSSVTFSSLVRNDFFLNTYHDRRGVLHAIQNLQYMGQGTNTSYALKYVHDNSFTAAHGARDNATHIVVVITDGQSSDPTQTAVQAASLKKIATVFSIGIGPQIDRNELANIASNKHPFTVDSFDILHTIQDSLENAACSG